MGRPGVPSDFVQESEVVDRFLIWCMHVCNLVDGILARRQCSPTAVAIDQLHCMGQRAFFRLSPWLLSLCLHCELNERCGGARVP